MRYGSVAAMVAWIDREEIAAVEGALVAFCGTRGPAPSDEALWAEFAWRFGYAKLVELTERGESEMRQPGRDAIPPAERPKVLQSLINPFWYGRYPKKGRKGGAA